MRKITIKSSFAPTGSHPLTVTIPVLGTGSFGPWEKEKENCSLLNSYRQAGGNFYDTALVYGTWLDDSRTSYSERIIGKWMDGNRITDAVISTKGAHPIIGTSIPRVSPGCIRADLMVSLANLRRKSIDLYFLHRDDETKPIAPIMDELNRAAERGDINLLGASNWRAERIYQANDYCVQHNMRGFDISQVCVNIMRPSVRVLGDSTLVSMDAEQEKLYRSLGMPVMAFTAQAGGFVERYAGIPDEEIHSRYTEEGGLARLSRIREIMKDTGMSGTAITFAYLNSLSVTVLPVIGVSSKEHLEDCIFQADQCLTEDQTAYIDGK